MCSLTAKHSPLVPTGRKPPEVIHIGSTLLVTSKENVLSLTPELFFALTTNCDRTVLGTLIGLPTMKPAIPGFFIVVEVDVIFDTVVVTVLIVVDGIYPKSTDC